MENASPQMAMAPAKRKSSVIKWALVIGIAIVLNLFLTYVVRVMYTEPDYLAFCPNKQVNEAIETKEACVEAGGQWNENPDFRQPTLDGRPTMAGYCNTTFTCSKNFDEALKNYNRNVFIVFVVAGVLLLIGSTMVVGAEAISLGLSFGGVLALIIGSMRYWSAMDDMLRVVILGFALAALIYVAWKKFKD